MTYEEARTLQTGERIAHGCMTGTIVEVDEPIVKIRDDEDGFVGFAYLNSMETFHRISFN